MAVGLACEWLTKSKVKKVVITRATLHLSQVCGFSTGSYKEKAMEYFQQQRSYFEYFIGKKNFQVYYDNGDIEICLLENMRGRDYESALMILDEAQECTKDDILLFQTRMSKYSKMIICGDREQSYYPNSFFEKMYEKLDDDVVSKVRLTEEDVLRHPDMYRVYKKIKAIE